MTSYALVGMLVETTLRATILLGAAGIVTTVWRGASAAARHLVWALALGGSLVLPALAIVMPRVPVPHLPDVREALAGAEVRHVVSIVPSPSPSALSGPRQAARPVDVPVTIGAKAGVPEALGVAVTAALAADEAVRARALAPDASFHATIHEEPRDPAAPASRWPRLLAALWAIGAVLVLVPVILGRLRVRLLARRATPAAGAPWGDLSEIALAELGVERAVRVLESSEALMPMTWGVTRPVVLLPRAAGGWSERQRHDVLLHELAHVQRLDCLTQFIAQLACAVHWFNPLVWVAARRLQVEREHACDDRVLASGARPSDYASHLLDVARAMRVVGVTPLGAVAMARRAQLSERLLAVLDETRPRGAVSRRIALRAWALGTLCAMLLAALSPAARAAAASRAAPELTPAAVPGPRPDTAQPLGSSPATVGAGLVRLAEDVPLRLHADTDSVWVAPATPRRATFDTAFSDGRGHVKIHRDASGTAMTVTGTHNVVLDDDGTIRIDGTAVRGTQLRGTTRTATSGASAVAVGSGVGTGGAGVAEGAAVAGGASGTGGSNVVRSVLGGDGTFSLDAGSGGAMGALAAAGRHASTGACDATTTSQHIESNDGEQKRTKISWKGAGCSIDIDAEGEVTIAPDMSDVTAISRGGYFELTERRGGAVRRLDVRNDAGTLVRSYTVNGEKRELDAAGRQWLGALLLELERHSGAFAAMRVPALLKSGGVDAVLAEVDRLASDYARRLYLTTLLSSGTRLDDATLARAATLAGRAISSDYELRSALEEIAAAPGFGTASTSAYVEAARTLQSDYERRTALVALATRASHPSTAVVRAALAGVRAMKSDYEKATSLLAFQDRGLVDAEVTDDFLAAAATIGSDYELRRAMTPLVARRELDAKSLAGVFMTAQRMKSDYERAELLIAAVRGREVDGAAREALDAAIGGIGSQYERGRVLDATRRVGRPTQSH